MGDFFSYFFRRYCMPSSKRSLTEQSRSTASFLISLSRSSLRLVVNRFRGIIRIYVYQYGKSRNLSAVCIYVCMIQHQLSQNTKHLWKNKKTVFTLSLILVFSSFELRDMRFHDIRQRFASLLLSNGESPVYVKGQPGHSSIQMTVDIYGHLILSSNRQALNALDENAAKRTLSAPIKNKKAATY